MRHGSRTLRLGGAGLLLLILVASWSYYQMASHRRSALRSALELTDCVELAGQIKALDNEPKRAQSGVLAHTDLTRRVEAAAGASAISSSSLTRIDAMPPRRLAKLPYEERSTRVTLGEVTLPQLVGFLHRLSDQTQDLWVKDIKLRAPRSEEVGNSWQADATLSYLIYTPPDTPDTPVAPDNE